MEIHTFRLKENSKLKESILKFAKDNNISAGIILSVVGAVKNAHLRMAGATSENQDIRNFDEEMEIVSFVGNFSSEDCHFHLSLSDKVGKVVGGHLKEAIVGVTCEISFLKVPNKKFARHFDQETGFKELFVKDI